jgi:hypothetical protein
VNATKNVACREDAAEEGAASEIPRFAPDDSVHAMTAFHGGMTAFPWMTASRQDDGVPWMTASRQDDGMS